MPRFRPCASWWVDQARRWRTRAAPPPLPPLPPPVWVPPLCHLLLPPFPPLQLGAGMELFMIKTGFYEKVTELEAQRLEETREEREAFLAQLRAELERQAAEKGVQIKLPPAPAGSSGGSSGSSGIGGGAGG